MLDLDYSTEQVMLKETVRDVLARECPLSVVRELEDDPIGYPPSLWATFQELDLVGILLPEEYGGSGMSLIEGVAIYEELGRALVPGPLVASHLAAGLIDGADDGSVVVGLVERPAARTAGTGVVPPTASVNEDAVSALVNLGYRRIEAFGAVARVSQRLGEGAALDAVIRAGLQELAR